MGQIRNTPNKTSALLVEAIRKLKNIHGSTSREITNYVASECDGPKKNLKRLMKLALRRGISAGLLRRSKDGYYTAAVLEDLEVPRERCGGRRKKKKSCRSRRRKRSCGRRRRRAACGKRRRRKSKCGRRRRKRRCGGRRRGEGVEVEERAARGPPVRRQRGGGGGAGAKGRKTGKNKAASKSSSSEMRMSSASSGGTRGSGIDTASADLSASGKESLSDHSVVSGTSDGTAGETKP